MTNNYFKIIITTLSFFALSTALSAQEHHHSHGLNEAGVSLGAVYAPNDAQWGVGAHVHYFRKLGEHSKWSLGSGFEEVWTEGNHFSFAAGAKYEIIERLEVGLLPGVAFLKHDTANYEAHFTIHAEVVYILFQWERIHLGPSMDFSWMKDDAHFMLGVHAAFSF